MSSTDATVKKTDEERLAELGYRQDLKRSWSGFQNFAISFTIISILAGCFTTYGQGWNNGGPVVISWGWLGLSALILIIGFCMSELVSAYPTAGGIYWWAAELGGPGWAWFTGWFNLTGLIAIVASVDYACATFLNTILGLYGVDIFGMNFGDTSSILSETFVLFVIILLLHVVVNIFTSHLVAIFNSVSVWWHVIGVAAIVVVLVLVPDKHASADFVFTKTINNSGFSEGMFWFYVFPVGLLLTQYTITGFDASAHISEETHGPTNRRRRACGGRSSTRRSSAGSCCWRSPSRRPTRRPSPRPAARPSPSSSRRWGPPGSSSSSSSRPWASCSAG